MMDVFVARQPIFDRNDRPLTWTNEQLVSVNEKAA